MSLFSSRLDQTVTQRFAYAIDKRYLPLLVPFGLRGSKDGVTLADDGTFLATFGFLKLQTAVANITGAHITRGYRWWTAFGARASVVDDGLTFGTNHDAGVCVHFAEKVPSPLRRSGHSALTVTVEDLRETARAARRRCGTQRRELTAVNPPEASLRRAGPLAGVAKGETWSSSDGRAWSRLWPRWR